MNNLLTLIKQNIIQFQKELRIYHIVFAITVGIGFIMFWYGVWELTSIYLTPWQSIILGLFIIWISSLLILKLVGASAIEQNIYENIYDKEEITPQELKKNAIILDKPIQQNINKQYKIKKIKITN